MNLEEIKADIARRGWKLDYCNAQWFGDNEQVVRIFADRHCYDSALASSELLAVRSVYEKALEGEGVKVDRWESLTKAMADEGFAWSLTCEPDGRLYSAYAWTNDDTSSVKSSNPDCRTPVRALADLLEKCRAKWSKPHLFDALSLDELLDICDARGWKWALMKGKDQIEFCEDRSDKVLVQLNGSKPGGGMFADWYVSRVDGLRKQMKQREAAEVADEF